MAYWLLRNEGAAVENCYSQLGGESRVRKCCSEFKNDAGVALVKENGLTLSGWLAQLRGSRARSLMGMGAIYVELEFFRKLDVPKRDALKN